jgi:membrane fusion protein (multidrug efflux system)
MADATPEFSVDTAGAEDTTQADRQATRRKWLVRVVIAVAAVAVLYGLWYFLVGRNHVGTDNAYVNAEVAQVTPLISAQAIAVNVSDTQTVKRGDILVKLDPTNARIAVAQAEADLADARRRSGKPSRPTPHCRRRSAHDRRTSPGHARRWSRRKRTSKRRRSTFSGAKRLRPAAPFPETS